MPPPFFDRRKQRSLDIPSNSERRQQPSLNTPSRDEIIGTHQARLEGLLHDIAPGSQHQTGGFERINEHIRSGFLSLIPTPVDREKFPVSSQWGSMALGISAAKIDEHLVQAIFEARSDAAVKEIAGVIARLGVDPKRNYGATDNAARIKTVVRSLHRDAVFFQSRDFDMILSSIIEPIAPALNGLLSQFNNDSDKKSLVHAFLSSVATPLPKAYGEALDVELAFNARLR